MSTRLATTLQIVYQQAVNLGEPDGARTQAQLDAHAVSFAGWHYCSALADPAQWELMAFLEIPLGKDSG